MESPSAGQYSLRNPSAALAPGAPD
jgi:hypothetical protein